MQREKIIFGILAGVFITMAAVAFLAAPTSFIGSILFAFGLLTIVNYNFQLFTGVVGYISTQQNRNDYYKYSLFCLNVWVFNFIGAIITGTLIRYTRMSAVLLPKLEVLMKTKCADSFTSLLILGIFCGILMFIAVNTYKRTEAFPIAKIVLLFACVVVFILSGYEHCIANMAYISLYGKINPDIIKMLAASSLGNIIGCNLVPLLLRLSRHGINEK